MELVAINSVEDISIGDVVVANYPSHAFAVLIKDVSHDREGTVWTFQCGPVTRISRDMKLEQSENMTFVYGTEESDDPLSAYVVR